MSREELFIRRRMEAVAGLVALGLALLAVRAVDLHWIQSAELKEVAEKQRFRQFETTAPRGPITDRNGRILAESIEVPSIAAMADEVPGERYGELAKALHMTSHELKSRLHGKRGFVWLSRQVTPAIADRVAALNIPGIRRETEWRRYNPQGPETGHLLGFVGIDGHGLEGLERSLDDHLSGTPGIRLVQRDARGHSLPGGIWIKQPQIGESVQLSIDSSIQSIAYAALANGVRQNEARGGSVVIMRPQDGAVLAMANWPGFNPNNFRHFHPGEWRNRAVTDVFEPGSTLKPFTVAAALETGKWEPDSRIFCENGAFAVADHVIHDDHAEGWLDLNGIIMRSSNIGAAKLALNLGPERLFSALTQVGFRQRTGIGLPGESPGILLPVGRWGPVETANIAFGQGIAVTPLQLATAFCVLANGGKRVQPSLINGRQKLQGERIFSKHTTAAVMRMLEAATSQDGTGKRAEVAGYRIAGKTGTAQKAGKDGNYTKGKYTAVFAGIAPADNPQLVIVVVIDEPKDSIYGGSVAAPIFHNIAATALPYLGISPELPQQDEWQLLQTRAQNGDGLATANTVGHFLGMSLRQAMQAAHRQHYRLRTHGSGWVYRQKPVALADLPAGDTVEVWLHE